MLIKHVLSSVDSYLTGTRTALISEVMRRISIQVAVESMGSVDYTVRVHTEVQPRSARVQ